MLGPMLDFAYSPLPAPLQINSIYAYAIERRGLKRGRPWAQISTFMSSKAPRVVKGVLDNGLGVQEAGHKVLWLSGALREEIALVTDPGILWQRWGGDPSSP